MKKGFTLIELLAVIVILAIIAVIAVPIVLNIIDESKENAVLRSGEFYLDAVDYAIANRVMNHGQILDNAYPIMSNGDICLEVYDEESGLCTDNDGNLENNKLIVDVNGEKPSSGTIIIQNGQIVNELAESETKTKLVMSGKTLIRNEKNEFEIEKTETDGDIDEEIPVVDEACTIQNVTTGTGNLFSNINLSDCKMTQKAKKGVFVESCNKNNSCTRTHAKVGTIFKFDPVNYEICESGDTCYEWIVMSTNGDVSFEAMKTTQITSSAWGSGTEGPKSLMIGLYNSTKHWSNKLLRNDSYSDTIGINCSMDDSTWEVACTGTNSYAVDYTGLKARIVTSEEWHSDYYINFAEEDGMGYIIVEEGKDEGLWSISAEETIMDPIQYHANYSLPNCYTMPGECSVGHPFGIRPIITLPLSILD